MKATVNFEFASDELEEMLASVLTKVVTKTIGSVDPTQMQSVIAGVTSALQQGLLGSVTGHRHTHVPMPRVQSQPGFGFAGSPRPPPGYAPPAPVPDNVRSIRTPEIIEHCFMIEEARNLEAGWGCCRCGTYNATQRAACRHCGHACCVPIAPPRPSPPESPKEPVQ